MSGVNVDDNGNPVKAPCGLCHSISICQCSSAKMMCNLCQISFRSLTKLSEHVKGHLLVNGLRESRHQNDASSGINESGINASGINATGINATGLNASGIIGPAFVSCLKCRSFVCECVKPRLTCNICNRQFRRPADLSSHISACSRKFDESFQLSAYRKAKLDRKTTTKTKKMPIRAISPPPPPIPAVPFRLPVFQLRPSKDNFRFKTPAGRKVFDCNKCGARFFNLAFLYMHEKREHRENSQRFVCEKCDSK